MRGTAVEWLEMIGYGAESHQRVLGLHWQAFKWP